MQKRARRPAQAERGQILVVVAVGFMVIMLMVGLIIDGGYALGQQRQTQNAADAAAESGAVVLAERIAGITKLDADVFTAVSHSAAVNGVALNVARYTNVAGELLDAGGSGTTGPGVEVGVGPIPPNAAGVAVQTSHQFATFLARLVGLPTFTTVAEATAVAGYVTGVCSGEDGCLMLPMTFFDKKFTCNKQNSGDPDLGDTGPWPFNSTVTIPFCKNGAPGSVGWLDWDASGGGTQDLIDAVNNPDNVAMSVPTSLQVAETGRKSSPDLEAALRQYGQNQIPMLIPLFSSHSGSGSNLYYNFTGFIAFQFDGVGPNYGVSFNDNQDNYCADAESNDGSGVKACIKGRIIPYVTVGQVSGTDPLQGGVSALGVQLIR